MPRSLFDEPGYLRANPDVAALVRLGKLRSGYQHYVEQGFAAGRPAGGWPQEQRNQLLPVLLPELGGARAAPDVANAIEGFVISPHAILAIGWIDDTESPLDNIRIVSGHWRVVIDAASLVRVRRTDAETNLGRATPHCYGFCAFLATEQQIAAAGPCVIELWLANGHVRSGQKTPRMIDDIEMRSTVLGYLAEASFLGNRQVEAVASLNGGAGAQIVALNRIVTARIKSAPYVERFGAKPRRPHGSIIICLYGKTEFLFLQAGLFAGLPSIENYEFIVVLNSPELAEELLLEAGAATLIYRLELTVVVLPGNAGFGAANNIAVGIARSTRIIIMNPDVFPRQRDWAARHTSLIGTLRAEQCRIFGVPLYYDDGSLMHGGMYFERDTGLSLTTGAPVLTRLLRVEHYGKGAPADAQAHLQPRPVPAVTGAFISCDRAWFELLGGFTEEYVFGHYEDADLCLKSWQRDTPPWVHDIRLWHLEGKGSTRLAPHEGGSLVNRWLFSRRWGQVIDDGLLGPTPARLTPLARKRGAV